MSTSSPPTVTIYFWWECRRCTVSISQVYKPILLALVPMSYTRSPKFTHLTQLKVHIPWSGFPHFSLLPVPCNRHSTPCCSVLVFLSFHIEVRSCHMCPSVSGSFPLGSYPPEWSMLLQMTTCLSIRLDNICASIFPAHLLYPFMLW